MIPRLAKTVLAWLCCGQLFVAAVTPALWLDVPFVKQERNGCGAASIAMVMQYWRLRQGESLGENTSPARIQRALYSAKAHGIYASQVERYFRGKASKPSPSAASGRI